MLDSEHELPSNPPGDKNVYTLGSIGKHNIVIACLPKGKQGTTSAAVVATQMLESFSSIRFGLMIGVGGAIPTKNHDIRLGDVVVSTPTSGVSWCCPNRSGQSNGGRRL
jgi:nucleoside phosphorylase